MREEVFRLASSQGRITALRGDRRIVRHHEGIRTVPSQDGGLSLPMRPLHFLP